MRIVIDPDGGSYPAKCEGSLISVAMHPPLLPPDPPAAVQIEKVISPPVNCYQKPVPELAKVHLKALLGDRQPHTRIAGRILIRTLSAKT